MTAEQLRNSILQEAISGRLVPQDPNDEPASALLARIREEKARLVKEGKLKKKDLVETPITEEEIPFEIPKGWEWSRWGNLAFSIMYGYNAPAEDSGDIRMVRISDIQGNKVLWDKVPFCRINPKDIDAYLLRPNDILFARTGGTVGKSYIVTEVPYPSIYAGYLIRTQYSKQLCPQYLKYFMESQLYWSQLRDETIATAQPNCNGKKLAAMILPIPPLAEQKRIVAKLEELLPIVEQYGKAQKELDELNAALPARLRQSILQEAISGCLVPQDPNDEPAAALLQRIREEKARLVKEGKLKKKDLVETPITDEEKPFEIPETWNWCRLGELACERMGKTPPRGESEYWLNAKYPWVSISDMKDYGHVKMTKERVSEYAAKKVFRQISPIGSLLMSFKLTVGRTSILDIAAYHNEAIITIQPYIDQEFAFRNYLFYVLPLIANLGDSKDAIKGKTLNSTSLYNLYIPLPPLAEQKRIVAKIEELFEQIDKITK